MRYLKENRQDGHGENQAKTLKKFLIEHQSEFEYSLIPNMDHIDHRALNEKGIEILEVNYLTDNRYSLVYQYDWFVFSGCTNTDIAGTEKNKVTLKLSESGDVIFNLSALGN